ncbi:MAG: hypothetical protein D0433_06335 [Candidatus Thermochlorobacter aerophilum]|jgi:hypothetical protein|uniref:Uncharacterized protein n=1 Tax=Candidatus Thermochlorobacter aerophilus TaxID=1868324 RepID=A0A395M297_9BACT|nr:MAG: hypothetical protein D0433_06335 [Candidatus Thermochlorobacter aerophilum]
MTGQIHRRNEKILRNVAFTNFDFLELSEIYIHSGELTPREIAFVRERVQEMMEAKLLCDSASIPALKQASEERIMKFIGEARYRRLKADMELHYLEYCDRYLESNEPMFFSQPPFFERVRERLVKFIERLTNRK